MTIFALVAFFFSALPAYRRQSVKDNVIEKSEYS